MDFNQLLCALRPDLPKPQLQEFDGKYKDFSQFMHSFECNIGSISSLDDKAKLNYLIQFCKGEAKEFIESYVLLEPSEGYRKAKEMLKEQFGRSHVLQEKLFGSW